MTGTSGIAKTKKYIDVLLASGTDGESILLETETLLLFRMLLGSKLKTISQHSSVIEKYHLRLMQCKQF